MKRNPFYGISAAAMLLGCYMLNHALRLEPGHVGKLLLLMGVLQIYEVLLLALGAHLVATGRAPRDGLTVLLLETLFLLDATLLATELVTAHAGVGTAVAGMLVALAVAKIAYVRRVLPDALPAPVAVLLCVQAAVVFVLPVVVVQVAAARLLTPLSFYGLWWLALALPLTQKVIVEATRRGDRLAHVTWAWIPAVSLLGHLLALQWIHQVSFHIAFVAPFLLGLALAGERQHVVRQIALPAVAVLLSAGQSEALGLPLWGDGPGSAVSPLRLATLGAAAVYAVLARRFGYRWLIALAAAGGAAGLLGGSFASIADSVAALARLVARLLPRTAIGWGLAGIAAAFASLALGARRSLGGEGDRLPPVRPRRRGVRGPARGAVTTALLLAALASGSMLWALDTYPASHARQRSAALTCAALAAAAIWVGALARSRASGPPEDGPGMKVSSLALLTGIGALLVSCPVFSTAGHQVARNESWVVGDLRTVVSAQFAYQTENSGFFDGNLMCLAQPANCIRGYGDTNPRFLDKPLASLAEKKGYRRFFHPGQRPDAIPPGVSPTSVTTWAYVAVPVVPGSSGIRGFCGDSKGHLFFTPDGSTPSLAPDGTCDPATLRPLN